MLKTNRILFIFKLIATAVTVVAMGFGIIFDGAEGVLWVYFLFLVVLGVAYIATIYRLDIDLEARASGSRIAELLGIPSRSDRECFRDSLLQRIQGAIDTESASSFTELPSLKYSSLKREDTNLLEEEIEEVDGRKRKIDKEMAKLIKRVATRRKKALTTSQEVAIEVDVKKAFRL